MEVKTAAWGAVALVIAAFGAVVIYAVEREGIKSDLSKARKALTDQEITLTSQTRTLADREAFYAAKQSRIAAIDAVGQRIKTQEEKNAQISGRIGSLREGWAAARKDFAKDIDLIRQKTKDEITPALALADGKVLKSARFKEMKDQVVLLEHSDGIAKVPLSNMTKEWIGRLALGWNPKLSAELSGKPDEPEPVVKAAAAAPTVEMVQQEHRESVQRADVRDLDAKVKTLTRQISDAEQQIAKLNEVANEYDRKHQLALSKGNSSSHNVKRDQARRSMDVLQKQIAAAQRQVEQCMEQINVKSGL